MVRSSFEAEQFPKESGTLVPLVEVAFALCERTGRAPHNGELACFVFGEISEGEPPHTVQTFPFQLGDRSCGSERDWQNDKVRRLCNSVAASDQTCRWIGLPDTSVVSFVVEVCS